MRRITEIMGYKPTACVLFGQGLKALNSYKDLFPLALQTIG